jgi:hypothetical protein
LAFFLFFLGVSLCRYSTTKHGFTMKSMQRRFGTFQKRSDDQADVGAVLAEFKAADDMIERVSLDIAAEYSLACFPQTTN